MIINLCILVRLCFNLERTVYQGVMIFICLKVLFDCDASAAKAGDFSSKLVIKRKKTGKIEKNLMHQ